MSNIYSTESYQKISEIANAKPINISLFGDSDFANQVFGQQLGNFSTFGVYAPFWLPNFAYFESDITKLQDSLLELLRLTKIINPNGSIIIRLPPNFYCTSIECMHFLLEKAGFRQVNLALWQAIDIKKFCSQSDYESQLKHASRKVLKKLQRFNCRLEEICNKNLDGVSRAYDLVNNNRLSIGVKLKYSKEYLFDLINLYDQNIKIFQFLVDELPVAAAITHIPQDNFLHVAAWGDHGHSLSGSPMYQFASSLVNYCLDKKLHYLDFGISSDLSLYTPSLFKFKQNIGCQTSTQRTYQIEL